MSTTLDRGSKKLSHPEWFFVWTKGTPYITALCAWTKRDLIALVSKDLDQTWKAIRNQGGRAVRCTVTQK